MDDTDIFKHRHDFLVSRIQAGEELSPTELAPVLRLYKDPLLDYVASWLEGKIKRRRGPKKDRSAKRAEETYLLFLMVERYQREYEQEYREKGIKKANPRQDALARVAEETGIPADTVDKRTRAIKIERDIVYLKSTSSYHIM